MRALCLLSVFVSAVLAFSVEPLVAKRLLPAFGGSATVWVTCLVTFQGLMLLGYLYAHYFTRAPRAVQIALHVGLLVVPFLILPFGVPTPPPSGSSPLGRLVLELLRSAALPFLVLSTNSTLVQHWYSSKTGGEPWHLYAASNAGSLVGLLGYPLAIEPFVGLVAQATRWTVAYGAFALLTVALLAIAARGAPPEPPTSPPPSPPRIAGWIARSAIGALLLCSVSFWVTLDVAALPLLWVVPLALYLLTFVLAFSSRVPYPRPALCLLAMVTILVGLETTIGLAPNVWLVMLAGFGALFLGAWIVHGDLARDRPDKDRLSTYYLWIALGGFLGGFAGNVLAPLVFDSVAEYPLALAALAFAVAIEGSIQPVRETLGRRATWAIAAGMGALLVVAAFGFRSPWGSAFSLLPAAVLAAGIVMRSRPGLFGVGATLTAIAVVSGALSTAPVLEADRSFYGVLRIRDERGVRQMVHGTTAHGVERVGANAVPGVYYHPLGPLGDSVVAQPEGARIGIVGLGTGALAVLAKREQELVFYEIDPTVERLARRWFTYLDRAPTPASILLGDARLTLGSRPDRSLELLIIDAFSSDAIPVHLLTTEAVAMYLDKITPDGAVVFHVSNRFFDLRPVLIGAANAVGATALWRPYVPPEEIAKNELASPVWAVMITRSAQARDRFASRGWKRIDGVEPLTWTDDASSLVQLLRRPSPRLDSTD